MTTRKFVEHLPAMLMATCTFLVFWFQFPSQSWWHFHPSACLPWCQGKVLHSCRRHISHTVRIRWKSLCLVGNWVERIRDHSLLFDMFAKFPIVKLQTERKQTETNYWFISPKSGLRIKFSISVMRKPTLGLHSFTYRTLLTKYDVRNL